MDSKSEKNKEKAEGSQKEIGDQIFVLDEIVDSLSKSISGLKIAHESETNQVLTEILVKIPDDGVDFREATRSFETNLIKKALRVSGGNQTRAAKLLKMNLTTLNAAIKRLSIDY